MPVAEPGGRNARSAPRWRRSEAGLVDYIKDGRLPYAYNWVGVRLQVVAADLAIEPGRHVFAAEFRAEDRSIDHEAEVRCWSMVD